LIDMKKTSTDELEELIPNVAQRFKYTSTLLNNLLHWAQSQMQGYSINPEVFDISHTVFNKKVLLQTSIDEKNLQFSFSDAEFLVYADLNMIDLVLQNLISNAIKYCNENDSVSISYSEENGKAVIAVADTGIGIEKEVMDKLFSKTFFSTPGTNKEKGTGLGLMLCKDFVEKNGGEIWAKSALGKGSTFYFSLPIPD
ncbi:MAG: HAMP domain-containing histidine kinase, partial [Balneolales bacterium]|nr:HAMP domain-containing histidine kinase [Balneolales bacterium]